MTSSIFSRSFKRAYNSFYLCNIKLRMTSAISFPTSNNLEFRRPCTTTSCYEDRDPAPLFFDKQVQEVLKKLTGLIIEKAFQGKHLEDADAVEEYKFLTKEELEETIAINVEKAKYFLQMPPVIREREEINEVLSFDSALQGRAAEKLVVTDISYGVSDRNRIIVVREPNGALRQATWEERDRMNYIYNPRPGRYHKVPPAFQEEYLKDTLNRGDYCFILDFACAHFEPDDPLYHKVTREAYERILKKADFEDLYSTRHYGPMCFYFAWTKKMDSLLICYIKDERIEEALNLIHLYYMINDKTKLVDAEGKEKVDVIKKYIEEDSKLKSNLELTLQTYQETLRKRESLENALKSSHGIS